MSGVFTIYTQSDCFVQNFKSKKDGLKKRISFKVVVSDLIRLTDIRLEYES